MFGYVRPPLEALPQEEADRFRRAYCGLCHTLGQRYGPAARMILNYDFTYLAILLSEPDGGGALPPAGACPAPSGRRDYQPASPALELAADESVILAYWQLRDGVADHGALEGHWDTGRPPQPWAAAYRKAAAARPDFDAQVRRAAGGAGRAGGGAVPLHGRGGGHFRPACWRRPPPRWRTRSGGGCWSRCSTTWAGGCTWWTRRTTWRRTPPPGNYNPVALRYRADGRQMGRGEPPGLCQDPGPLRPHDRHGL